MAAPLQADNFNHLRSMLVAATACCCLRASQTLRNGEDSQRAGRKHH